MGRWYLFGILFKGDSMIRLFQLPSPFSVCSGFWVVIAMYLYIEVINVETDIIISIASSPTGRYMMLFIMFVETFKTDIIYFDP